MLVSRTPIPMAEFEAFEAAIRAGGRDPEAFRAQMFETTCTDSGMPLRRVHVVSPNAAAQYDASGGVGWTESFARHVARGFFG
jgi:hypothetical protein